MKLLFDLFPVLLFFAVFKLAGSFPTQSLALATTLLGGFVGDGQVPPDQAPILLATATAIVASAVQVGWLLARGRKVEPMLWISLGVILVFGGATIWFHDETFIKWKPTILYWLFGGALLTGRMLWRKNLVKSLLAEQIAVADAVWDRLLNAWVGFFAVMGVINLAVAYSVSTDAWVSFKLFGLFGLTLVFMLGLGIYLSRHLKESGEAGDA
jgi:intracellular septation protein